MLESSLNHAPCPGLWKTVFRGKWSLVPNTLESADFANLKNFFSSKKVSKDSLAMKEVTVMHFDHTHSTILATIISWSKMAAAAS